MIKLLLEQESVNDLITKLRDTKFSNEQTRKDFTNIIVQLASIPDKNARMVIKKIGDYMTELGTEILNDSSELDDSHDVEYNEPYIVNMDKKAETIEEYQDKVGKKVKKNRDVKKYAQRFVK